MKMGFILLPPSPDVCQICAVKHEPAKPHDATSLFYNCKFKMEYGRYPTWLDAIAHCPREIRAAWKKELKIRGEWTE
jgi:hypothetical protein